MLEWEVLENMNHLSNSLILSVRQQRFVEMKENNLNRRLGEGSVQNLCATIANLKDAEPKFTTHKKVKYRLSILCSYLILSECMPKSSSGV